MKITNQELLTSGEVMAELFGMNKRLINNLPEKSRYEKIYEYLVKEQDAKKIGRKEGPNNFYTILSYQEEIYLIPEEIFDELEDNWKELLISEADESLNDSA